MSNKFSAKRVQIGALSFHSRKEAKRWRELDLLQKAGEISDLELQVPITLEGRDDTLKTSTGRPMKYVADFRYYDHRLKATVIEDAKGMKTEGYKIKKAICAAMGIEIKET